MDLNLLTLLIGWLGVALIVSCNIPQVVTALKYGRKVRVNKTTYTLLLAGVFCHLIRAIAIEELVFIVSNTLSFICIGIVRWKLRS